MSTPSTLKTEVVNVSSQDRKAIKEILKNDVDTALACEVLIVAKRIWRTLPAPRPGPKPEITYGLDFSRDEYWVLRILTGLSVVTDDDLMTIFRLDDRIAHIRLVLGGLPRKRQVHIRVSRSAHPTPAPPWTMPSEDDQKKRCRAIDYTESGISDKQDQRTLDAVVHAVYHIQDNIPLFDSWLDIVPLGKDPSEGPPIPLTQALAKSLPGKKSRTAAGSLDTSSSSVADIPEENRAAYALCFAGPHGLPDLPLDFITHLKNRYPARVLRVTTYLHPPPTLGTLPVICIFIKRTGILSTDALHRISTFTPRL